MNHQEDPSKDGSAQSVDDSAGSNEHPSWCAIQHDAEGGDCPRRSMSVIAHDVDLVGQHLVDLVIFDEGVPSGRAHVHLPLGECTSVGYYGYAAHDVADLAGLFSNMLQVMTAFEAGAIDQVSAPEEVHLSPLARVIEAPEG